MKTILAVLMLSVPVAAYAAANLTVDEKTELVRSHNRWRNQVNVPRLKWSRAVARIAQNYANNLKVTHACNLVHSTAGNLGENLFWASPLNYSDGSSAVQIITPTQVVDNWASEKTDYNYAGNTCAAGKVCGHYTQIVWRNTVEIGCGRAVCADNSQVWVCNYNPAGNIIGQRPY